MHTMRAGIYRFYSLMSVRCGGRGYTGAELFLTIGPAPYEDGGLGLCCCDVWFAMGRFCGGVDG